MQASFWHERWNSGEIGFHQDQVNAFLAQYLGELELSANSRIFVPLCGKSKDIGWLLTQGYQVVGAELSEIAVKAFFEEMGWVPEVTSDGELTLYRYGNLQIWQGDIFALSKEQLGAVDAIYDRAAIVALPQGVREKYCAHLLAISLHAPQLLISFDYDQLEMPGPPFSIPQLMLENYYGQDYRLEQLDSLAVEGKLKGKVDALEQVYILRP